MELAQLPRGQMFATKQMASLLADRMELCGITQVELARRIGRTTKHVNRVLNGHATSLEIEYWAFALGMRFEVKLVTL